MKKKLALFGLFCAFFCCYLAWGGGNSSFVYEMEYQLLFGDTDRESAFTHPMILGPFLGQLLILVALFLPSPKRWMIYTGMAMMGVLVLLLVFIGVMGDKKILLSTLPFLAFSIWLIVLLRQERKAEKLAA